MLESLLSQCVFPGVGFLNLPTYSKRLIAGKIHPIDQC
jgi:hypothetical protein